METRLDGELFSPHTCMALLTFLLCQDGQGTMVLQALKLLSSEVRGTLCVVVVCVLVTAPSSLEFVRACMCVRLCAFVCACVRAHVYVCVLVGPCAEFWFHSPIFFVP